MEILSILWAFVLGMTLCGCGRVLRDKTIVHPENDREIEGTFGLEETISIIDATAENVSGDDVSKGVSEVVSENDSLESFKEEVVFAKKSIPGVHSIENLITTALQPVGSTMYVWGGGWNVEDTGAGIEAVTLGVSPRWKEFYETQDSAYNYNNTKYQIHDGLDCSGLLGWLIYNTMETESYIGDVIGTKDAGYVMASTEMADTFAKMGWGEVYDNVSCEMYYPGDIVSMKGHVWVSLGTCEDGSVLVLHASPPGVKISGTPLMDGKKSQAVQLAELIMKELYSDWYERYPDCSLKGKYLTEGRVFHWNRDTLSDEEGLTDMSAEEIAELILGAYR